ncbi:MAG: hypothetical protein U5J83_07200 [Bryobacterales bacterium]|nr:hypothetical protein [Bryobacterales bacterium]
MSRLGLGPFSSDEQRRPYRSGAERTVDFTLYFLDNLLLFDWLFQSRDHLGFTSMQMDELFSSKVQEIHTAVKIPVTISRDHCCGRSPPPRCVGRRVLTVDSGPVYPGKRPAETGFQWQRGATTNKILSMELRLRSRTRIERKRQPVFAPSKLPAGIAFAQRASTGPQGPDWHNAKQTFQILARI